MRVLDDPPKCRECNLILPWTLVEKGIGEHPECARAAANRRVAKSLATPAAVQIGDTLHVNAVDNPEPPTLEEVLREALTDALGHGFVSTALDSVSRGEIDNLVIDYINPIRIAVLSELLAEAKQTGYSLVWLTWIEERIELLRGKE